MSFQFLPIPYNNPFLIDFNKLDYNSLSFNKIDYEGEDIGWGDYPVNGTSGEAIALQAKVAGSSGQKTLAKVLTAIAVYGPTLLGILQQTGVIGKRNDGTLSVNEQAALDALAKTNGTLNPNLLAKTETVRSATIFGVPVSTAVVIIGIALLYVLFKDELKSMNSKKRK